MHSRSELEQLLGGRMSFHMEVDQEAFFIMMFEFVIPLLGMYFQLN
jgi:hypothetical protein